MLLVSSEDTMKPDFRLGLVRADCMLHWCDENGAPEVHCGVSFPKCPSSGLASSSPPCSRVKATGT